MAGITGQLATWGEIKKKFEASMFKNASAYSDNECVSWGDIKSQLVTAGSITTVTAGFSENECLTINELKKAEPETPKADLVIRPFFPKPGFITIRGSYVYMGSRVTVDTSVNSENDITYLADQGSSYSFSFIGSGGRAYPESASGIIQLLVHMIDVTLDK